jgi:hypothetical protein
MNQALYAHMNNKRKMKKKKFEKKRYKNNGNIDRSLEGDDSKRNVKVLVS